MSRRRKPLPPRPPEHQPVGKLSGRVRRLAVVGAVAVFVAVLAAWWLAARPTAPRLDRILAAYRDHGPYDRVAVLSPAEGAVFPPEICAPAFRWETPRRECTGWLVSVEPQDGGPRRNYFSAAAQWTPRPDAWEEIKRRSTQRPAKATILGFHHDRPEEILAAASLSFQTSRDSVGAPLFYREVDLPFLTAVRDPARHIRWRFGTIDSPQQPPVVLENMPVCANCHSFSQDGGTLGMDVDYASDKGSYIVRPVEREMTLDRARVITWSDYRREDKQPTFGMLSQVSPDGRYVVSTVKDRSVFLPLPDLAFSQLFFPVQGILAVYERATNRFFPLPGADDPQYVQSNATWSPDGKYLVFARAKSLPLKNLTDQRKVLLAKEDVPEFLQAGGQFQYDLYRLPFNEGRGGQAEPLAGASHNGRSNYFARYSPDGKWIVFCQAKSFMLLQPDSQLYILPAAGGEARLLQGNTHRMNSWHSWSPNSRWLVFSSKAQSPYTQLFLTHIDQAGNSSPPVALEHFTARDKAGNIPEFVNARPNAIVSIHERFLNEQSYVDAGEHHLFYDDYDLAIGAFQKALELNPRQPAAYEGWGIALLRQGKFAAARDQLQRAVELQPDRKRSHSQLAQAYAMLGDTDQAIRQHREALRLDPLDADEHASLGSLLVDAGNFPAGQPHLAEAARLAPDSPLPQVVLGVALLRADQADQALAAFQQALAIDPDCVPALLQLASLRATSQQPPLRDRSEAIKLADKACTLTNRQDPGALLVLAIVYHEAGQTADAIRTAEQAWTLAQASGNRPVADTIRQRLAQWRER